MSLFSFGQTQVTKKEKEKVNDMLNEIDICKEPITTKFEDIGGLKDAKSILSEIVDFFENVDKYKAMGAKLPKGVLISGPPGTGKTLLAKSVAGETGLPIIYVPGSRFVDVYAGMGAEKVRSLFNAAKAHSPCIVFIDEIDTVGKKPGTVSNSSNDEREQTLNQLLSEMDGFEPSAGILVIGATNRPEALSPALLREGRFDRHIFVNKPELSERESIFKLYIDKIKAEDDIDIEELAYQAAGMTGAEIAGIVNEAAIKAVKAGKDTVEEDDLFDALEQKSIGFKHSNVFLNDREKGIAAVHEAARAVALIGLAPNCSVQGVSILPAADKMAGSTLKYQTKNSFIKTRAELLEEIQILLAGYCAELAYTGDVSTACSADIKESTEKAVTFVCEYGLSDNIGPVAFGANRILEFQQAEISSIIKICKESMMKFVTDNKPAIGAVARLLVEKESLSRNDLYEIISHNPILKDQSEKAKNLLIEIKNVADTEVKESRKKPKEKTADTSAKKKTDALKEEPIKKKEDKDSNTTSEKKGENRRSSVNANSVSDTAAKPSKSVAASPPDIDPNMEIDMDIPDDIGEITENDYVDQGMSFDLHEQLEEIEPIIEEKKTSEKKPGSKRRKRKDDNDDFFDSVLNTF